MATGVSSYQIGGRKQYGGKPRSRPTPKSSTRLAMRRQGKLPFKKTKTVTRSVKKPVVDPEKAGCDEEPKCYFAGKVLESELESCKRSQIHTLPSIPFKQLDYHGARLGDRHMKTL
ncbi:unnamed protein product [Camellia sinensis]